MSALVVADLCALPGARLLFGDPSTALDGVTTDTREPDIRGKLYVALKGERQDGHDHLVGAMEAGVSAVLISSRSAAEAMKRRSPDRTVSAVCVPDTLAALGDLARMYRTRLGVKIVAITGSNGKTSVKDFLAAILSTTYNTVSAVRSFNNNIGVPLTILRMTSNTQVGVLEMGMNHPGELSALCRIADPDLVAITSIAPAHIGFFRSVRSVAKAKAEILTASRAGIPAFLPADSEFLPLFRRLAKDKQMMTFGSGPESGWRVRPIKDDMRSMTFSVESASWDTGARKSRRPGKNHFTSPNFGEHQLSNLLLAVAISHTFSVPLKKIRAAVSKLNLPPGRGRVIPFGRHVIVDDSYNANPTSMSAAIDRIRALHRMLCHRGPRRDMVLVLGDMLELGDKSAHYHRELGRQAARARPWRFIFAGNMGDQVWRGFKEGGGEVRQFVVLPCGQECLQAIRSMMETKKKMILLFKSSHQVRLNLVIETLCQNKN